MSIALRITFTALIVIGSAIVFKQVRRLHRRAVSRRNNWSKVDGTVLAASIFGPYYHGDSPPQYHIKVKYEYEVGGKKMLGKQTWNEDSPGNLDKLKIGMFTAVWYNPLKPSESVVAGGKAPLHYVWLIGAWMAATLGTLIYVWLS